MVESLKQIKIRIRGIESTKKITRAMEMVSISKLKHIESFLNSHRSYFQALESIVDHTLRASEGTGHMFFRGGKSAESVGVCVITSDAGLCGTYNNAVIKCAEDFAAQHNGKNISLVPVGKRGFTYFKKKTFRISRSFTGLNGRYSVPVADEVAAALSRMFTDNQADEVYVAHMHFESLARYRPVVTKLFPMEKTKERPMDFSFEPHGERILDELLPWYIRAKIRLILVESFIAEHGCRMVAMKTASDNAKELMDALVVMRNKARQAAITKEVIEIISSSGKI